MNSKFIQSIQWNGENVILIDQTKLPLEKTFLKIRTPQEMWNAIHRLSVRGAPAIGIAAAYGLYLGIHNSNASIYDTFYKELKECADFLNTSRPTAVNLSWATNKILKEVKTNSEKPVPELKKLVLEIAANIHKENRKTCEIIGKNGEKLITDKSNVLTHCNTGSLATAKYGTALSVIYHAHKNGKDIHVWVDETRPLLQGARLTTWELNQANISNTLIVDSAAPFLMKSGKIDCIIVGADRIAANGDTANKIGTYMLALTAYQHDIPFYVAAPVSTIDISLKSGDVIPIEERDKDEVTHFNLNQTTPDRISAFNPAFDITPHSLITAIITEKKIIKPDFTEEIAKILE